MQWIYQPTTQTLTRYARNGSGTFSPSGQSLAPVSNPPFVPVFLYINQHGTDISSSNSSTIAKCTTKIEVHFYVSPKAPGVPTFQETADVAITDQLNLLTAPGNGQC
jgi:hypothetical protein